MKRLTIIGVGLIGGSIGLAARAAGWSVTGVDAPSVLDEAAAKGVIDARATADTLPEADLVVLAAPVSAILDALPRLAAVNVAVTDVGSTKNAIVTAAGGAGVSRFVGGHPMAGSTRGGLAHARADLFHDARWFLTPTPGTDAGAYREVARFVSDDLGATVTAVEPAQHDLLVAAVSHLPHLVAISLLAVAAEISPEALSFAGPSFRDLTRVGSSNPSLWADILADNHAALAEALDAFKAALTRLEGEIPDRGRVAQRFREARAAYEALGGIVIERSGANAEIAVAVENRPGVLAAVTTLLGAAEINIADLYMRHAGTRSAALVLTVDAAAEGRARELLAEHAFELAEDAAAPEA